MTLLILLTILFLILLVCGSIAGLIAYFSTKKLQEHLITLNAQITTLKAALKQAKRDNFKSQIKQKIESAPTSQIFSQSHLNAPVADKVVEKSLQTHTQSPQSTFCADSQTSQIPPISLESAQSTQSQPLKQKDFFDFEWLFTQRVMVFLAGIFFIFAAFFLIRYSLEHNLLTPVVRISLCICFGAILFASTIKYIS